MSFRRALAACGATALLAGACAGNGGDDVASQVILAPMPTVAGVGSLPDPVSPDRESLVEITRPVNEDGTSADLIGSAAEGNRLLMIGDSILASTATRYSGYMCDVLVPLGWAVAVEAEPGQFIEFGNDVLDELLPESGEDDWDAAAVFLGSNYRGDQDAYEEELREILDRLAPRPTLLYTVTEYRSTWAEVNEVVREVAEEYESVTLIDWQAISSIDGVLSGDRLHPTDLGRQVLVDVTAAALGPAAVGEGECIPSEFTDDSASGRGGSSSPASQISGSGSVTATTQAPSSGGSATTTPPAPTVPPSTAAPTTAAPTTAAPAPTEPPPAPDPPPDVGAVEGEIDG